MYQMIELADQIRLRGGQPLDPLVYKKTYLDLLHSKIAHRLEELRQGQRRREVPGARRAGMARSSQGRGLKMYLASGTDQPIYARGGELVGVSRYFDGRGLRRPRRLP